MAAQLGMKLSSAELDAAMEEMGVLIAMANVHTVTRSAARTFHSLMMLSCFQTQTNLDRSTMTSLRRGGKAATSHKVVAHLCLPDLQRSFRR
eukprot:SAG31_NODE_740_length_12438_cov_10.788719_7_plen_92_part_00